MDLENKEQGFIFLYRQLKDELFYKDSEHLHLWIHILLSTNHKDNFHKGITIKSGSFKTGRKKLSSQTGISESKVERILSFLASEQLIEQQKTNKYRIITVVKWRMFQKVNSKVNNTQQQTNSKRTTQNTNNNDNNDENKTNTNKLVEKEFNSLWDLYPNKKGKDESFKSFLRFKANKISLQDFKQAIENYCDYVKTHNTEKRFMMNGSTFFNTNNGKWKDYIRSEKEAESEENGSDLFKQMVEEERKRGGFM